MLYDLGYQNFKSSSTILELIHKLSAVLVDVRYAPWSNDAQWQKSVLAEQLGNRYIHLQDLGNVDYQGATIRIQNLERGMEEVERILCVNPVILMCACWDRPNCHRMVIIKAFEQEGVTSTDLSRKVVEEILKGTFPSEIQQLTLLK